MSHETAAEEEERMDGGKNKALTLNTRKQTRIFIEMKTRLQMSQKLIGL